MLVKALIGYGFGALIPLVRAQKKSTYDFEGFPGDHKKWVPEKGCIMLIQAPANTEGWKQWELIKNCGKDRKLKVFPYCVSNQAPADRQGHTLQEVANMVYLKKDPNTEGVTGLNAAWGGDHFYVVRLLEATDQTLGEDDIKGTLEPVHLIDQYGKLHMRNPRAGSSWYSDQVTCSNPYKWTMEEKFVY